MNNRYCVWLIRKVRYIVENNFKIKYKKWSVRLLPYRLPTMYKYTVKGDPDVFIVDQSLVYIIGIYFSHSKVSVTIVFSGFSILPNKIWRISGYNYHDENDQSENCHIISIPYR